MSDSQAKLSDLLVDEEAVNEELLAGLLGKYVEIGKQSGALIPKSAYEDLNARQKIVVVLLAQKAKYELDLADTEWLSPGEISDACGMKKGTIYPKVRELEDEYNLADGDNGSYRVPAHNFTKARNLIEGESS